jgi:hypothetical protein
MIICHISYYALNLALLSESCYLFYNLIYTDIRVNKMNCLYPIESLFDVCLLNIAI